MELHDQPWKDEKEELHDQPWKDEKEELHDLPWKDEKEELHDLLWKDEKGPLSIAATRELFQRTLGKLLSDVVEHMWELPCEQIISCSLIAVSSVRRLLGPGQAACHSTCILRVDERVAKLPVTGAISQ